LKQFTEFRADIEGMRAVAVALVVIFHAKLGILDGGFIGVDVFFAISGYLITGLIFAEIEKNGKLDFLSFYARRGRRLIPAVTAMIVVVLLVSYFVYAPDEIFEIAKSGAASAIYLSNMYFATQSTGYFSTGVAENPFLHTWSLSVEEQFYLFWPMLIILFAKFSRGRLALLLMLGLTTIASFALGLWLVKTNLNMGFFALPGRVWEFGLGGFARLLIADPSRLPKLLRTIIGWSGLGLVLGSAMLLTEWIRFPGWPALIPVLGTVMVLSVGGQSLLLDKVLGAPIMQWFGRRSYAIYLWHWPFFVIPVIWFGEPTLVHKLLYLAGAILAAHISYHLVENPVRRHPWLLKRKIMSIVLTGGFAFVAGASAVTAYVGAKIESRQPVYQAYTELGFRQPDVIDKRPECLVWPTTNPTLEVCEFSEARRGGQIILVGDSHAHHWFSPVFGATQDNDLQMTTIMKASCPLADVESYDVFERRANPQCVMWRKQAIQEILDRRPRLAVISMATGGHVANTIAWGDNDLGVSKQEWAEGLARTLGSIADAGVPVLLIQHTPRLITGGVRCLARAERFGRDPLICARNRARAMDQGIFDLEQALLEPMPLVTLVNLTDNFCDEQTCFAERDGVSIFRDAHHVSDAWARTLQPEIEAAIMSAIATAQ